MSIGVHDRPSPVEMDQPAPRPARTRRAQPTATAKTWDAVSPVGSRSPRRGAIGRPPHAVIAAGEEGSVAAAASEKIRECPIPAFAADQVAPPSREQNTPAPVPASSVSPPSTARQCTWRSSSPVDAAVHVSPSDDRSTPCPLQPANIVDPSSTSAWTVIPGGPTWRHDPVPAPRTPQPGAVGAGDDRPVGRAASAYTRDRRTRSAREPGSTSLPSSADRHTPFARRARVEGVAFRQRVDRVARSGVDRPSTTRRRPTERYRPRPFVPTSTAPDDVGSTALVLSSESSGTASHVAAARAHDARGEGRRERPRPTAARRGRRTSADRRGRVVTRRSPRRGRRGGHRLRPAARPRATRRPGPPRTPPGPAGARPTSGIEASSGWPGSAATSPPNSTLNRGCVDRLLRRHPLDEHAHEQLDLGLGLHEPAGDAEHVAQRRRHRP